jgi:hypothetical protein
MSDSACFECAHEVPKRGVYKWLRTRALWVRFWEEAFAARSYFHNGYKTYLESGGKETFFRSFFASGSGFHKAQNLGAHSTDRSVGWEPCHFLRRTESET